MSRARALAAGLALLAGAPAATAADPADPLLAAARLQGFYTMTGVVTQAVGVPGERRGDQVQRIWAFISPCPAGACPSVQLVRRRASGIDRLTLVERAPAVYAGTGSFVVAVRCHGRRYARGARVPFTITVRVTAEAPAAGAVQATQIQADYRNTGRIGLTRCFHAPSHDSAAYVGAAPAPAPPPAAGAIRSVARMASSAGS